MADGSHPTDADTPMLRLLRAIDHAMSPMVCQRAGDDDGIFPTVALKAGDWRSIRRLYATTVAEFRAQVEEAIIREINDPRNAGMSADFRDGLRVARVILNKRAQDIGEIVVEERSHRS